MDKRIVDDYKGKKKTNFFQRKLYENSFSGFLFGKKRGKKWGKMDEYRWSDGSEKNIKEETSKLCKEGNGTGRYIKGGGGDG